MANDFNIDDLFDAAADVAKKQKKEKVQKIDTELFGKGKDVSIALEGNKAAEMLANLTPEIQHEVKQIGKNLKTNATKLYNKHIGDNEGVSEHYADGFDKDVKAGMFDLITKAQSPDAETFDEGFEDAVKEDYLLGKFPSVSDKKHIEASDPALGTIELDGEIVKRRVQATDEALGKAFLNQAMRFLSPESISKELITKNRILELKKLLLNERTYALYRHKFIHEKYNNILRSLPKMIREEEGDAYLREAFMVLHVLFKFGKATETLDEHSIAELIVSQDHILPSSQMHDRPFTVDFFIGLATEGVFKKIQRMVNEDILSNQLTDMIKYVSTIIDDMVKGETKSSTKDLKDLTDMLSKIQAMSNSLNGDANMANTISYVFNETSDSIDYSKLAELEVIDPDQTVPFDFNYYIGCFDINLDKEEQFVGWLNYNGARRQYEADMENMKIWHIPNGDKRTESELVKVLADQRESGKHAIYKVFKMYNKQHKLPEEIK